MTRVSDDLQAMARELLALRAEVDKWRDLRNTAVKYGDRVTAENIALRGRADHARFMAAGWGRKAKQAQMAWETAWRALAHSTPNNLVLDLAARAKRLAAVARAATLAVARDRDPECAWCGNEGPHDWSCPHRALQEALEALQPGDLDESGA